MNNAIAIAVAVFAGVAGAVQSATNATLGRAVGLLGSTFMAFAVGLVPTGLAILFYGQANLTRLTSVPAYYWCGGLLGFIIVVGMILAVPQIGLATSVTAFVVAQVVVAVILDHFGLFGLDRMPVTSVRLVGVVMLIVALRLVFR